jgi:hypothetical protein
LEGERIEVNADEVPGGCGQCEWGLPVPHSPQELGWPVQPGSAPSRPLLEAKTDNFFISFVEPHFGQGVPFHWVERMSSSESCPHFSQ